MLLSEFKVSSSLQLTEKCFRKAKKLYPEQREYLKQFDTFGLDKTAALVDLGLFEEAADNLTGPENNIKSIELYLKARTSSSLEKLSKLLLEEWWNTLPCSSVIQTDDNPNIKQLLQFSYQVDPMPKGLNEEVRCCF
jgi:hypothetical protein